MSAAHRRLIRRVTRHLRWRAWLSIPPLWESAYSPHHALPPEPPKDKDKGKPRHITHTTWGRIPA
jgi:hypothetical protein